MPKTEAPPIDDVLTVRGLRVVDEQGRARITLALIEEGCAQIEVVGDDPDDVLSLGAGDMAGPFVFVNRGGNIAQSLLADGLTDHRPNGGPGYDRIAGLEWHVEKLWAEIRRLQTALVGASAMLESGHPAPPRRDEYGTERLEEAVAQLHIDG